MPVEPASGHQRPQFDAALERLAVSAATHIPGVDFVSITVNRPGESLSTIVSTDPLAEQADSLQYDLREGPCYSAVTDERFVLVNDLAGAREYPRYGPKAAALGLGAQAAIQLVHSGPRVGLNMYAYLAGALDRSTGQLAELFASQGAVLFAHAEQVEQLSEALQTRTDIGTAVGILMERYDIDQRRAFDLLSRTSSNRNIKVRVLAQEVINS